MSKFLFASKEHNKLFRSMRIENRHEIGSKFVGGRVRDL
jgi:hypothetical protein